MLVGNLLFSALHHFWELTAPELLFSKRDSLTVWTTSHWFCVWDRYQIFIVLSLFEMNIKSWFEWSSKHLEPYGAKASRLGVAFQNPVKLESALDFPFIEDNLIIWEGIFGNLFIWNFQHENGLQLWPNWDVFSFFFFGPFLCLFVLKIWLFGTFWKRLVQWRLIYQTKRRKRVALLASSLVYISCVSNYKSLPFIF